MSIFRWCNYEHPSTMLSAVFERLPSDVSLKGMHRISEHSRWLRPLRPHGPLVHNYAQMMSMCGMHRQHVVQIHHHTEEINTAALKLELLHKIRQVHLYHNGKVLGHSKISPSLYIMQNLPPQSKTI